MESVLERTSHNLDFNRLATDVLTTFGKTTIYKLWGEIKTRAISHDPVALDLVDMVRGGQIQLTDLLNVIANSEPHSKNGGTQFAGTEPFQRYQRRDAPEHESRS
ncbi:MAG: hypothetical protein ACR2KS_10200 [Candidatus Eremiobacter antarcticus]|nr:hypothetical protein [Candidatus Eremiobacteraeota bacterium]MBC5808804.1 hypothetical protein [Candidatus Eremiobacteraeota bacterium]